ncbi:eukaryotic initiation factor-4e [Cystoisospora suis]|uniref:Eukaryotic initiation factor-4e n=1 Tax=Cystoisospora suis TaxID=483139 RepID=A0A2C6KR77_9APIC|nr:eukaryotic initiation factor-4e [Cystoisospora suis]
MDVIWESLVLSSIGEMFDCSDVVGVVLNKKMKEVVFSVWIEANEDGHVDPLVSQRIKEKLSELCPPFASPYFQYRSFEVFLKETRGGHNKTRGSSRSPGGAPKRDGGGDRKETDASPHLHPHHSYYCASPSASPSFKPSSYKVNGSVGDYYQPPHPNSSSSKRNAQQGSSLLPSPVLSAKGEFPRPFHAAPPLLPTPRGGGGGSASATSTTTTTAGGSSAVSSSSSSSS